MTITGSGTSTGVPVIGCRCVVCTSSDPRDCRMRSSLLITLDSGEHLAIDTGPDFRMQMLNAGVRRLEHVLYTHNHADHCHGFDDLRAFYFRDHCSVTCHLPARHADDFRQKFAYAFHDTGYLGTKPQVEVMVFEGEPFRIYDLTIEPAYAPHGNIQSAVFRFGRFVYATDFKAFPQELIERWRGRVDVMVGSGIRYGDHPTHSCIQQTCALFAELQVKRGYVTHIAHDVLHARDNPGLPPGVQLSYDGLSFRAPVTD